MVSLLFYKWNGITTIKYRLINKDLLPGTESYSWEIWILDPKSNINHVPWIRIPLFNNSATESESNFAQDLGSDSIF